MIYTSVKSKKKTKITRAQQTELEQRFKERNRMLKSIGQPTETFEQFMDFVNGRGPKIKPQSTERIKPSYQSQTKESVPNMIRDWTTGAVSSKPSQQYTGTEVIGVSVLHKSCLQPVFSKSAAVDIAKMRRS